MKITILTLFPEMFSGPFDYSIVKRAKEKNLIKVTFVNIREFGIGRHRIVDDTPYGGGIGMVMRVDVLHKAIEYAKNQSSEDVASSPPGECKAKIVLLSAGGKPFTQQKAQEFSELDHLILMCGHYEGVDARIKTFIDEEISIGDFIVTGGEIPAMLIADSVTRLIPGVLPEGATEDESFSTPLLEYPHFTKPRTYEDQSVPEILLSGDHAKILEWRTNQAIKNTKLLRPDLLKMESGIRNQESGKKKTKNRRI